MKRQCLIIVLGLMAGVGCNHGSSAPPPPTGIQPQAVSATAPQAVEAAFTSQHPGATVLTVFQNGSNYTIVYHRATGVQGRATYAATGQLLQDQ